MKAHYGFLAQLILRCSVQDQPFLVSLKMWYRPSEEDIYFITGLSRRGEYFPKFPNVPHGVVVEIQLVYPQIYVWGHVVR